LSLFQRAFLKWKGKNLGHLCRIGEGD
jgi:hypothetical protein